MLAAADEERVSRWKGPCSIYVNFLKKVTLNAAMIG